MNYKLSEEQKEALIDWAKESYKQGGTTGWGPKFDAVMVIARDMYYHHEHETTTDPQAITHDILIKR